MDDLLKVDEPEFIINIHFICLFIFFKYKFYCVLLYLTIYDMIRYMRPKKKKKKKKKKTRDTIHVLTYMGKIISLSQLLNVYACKHMVRTF